MDDVIAQIPAVVTFPDQAAFQTIFNGGNVWLCGGLFFFFSLRKRHSAQASLFVN